MINYRPEQYTFNKVGDYKMKQLSQAASSGEILEAKVLKCNNDMSLTIDLGKNIVGIINIEDFEYNLNGKVTKNVALISKVGKNVQFKVVEYLGQIKGKNAFKLSRKLAQQECYDNYINKLEVGQVISAYAHYVESYGIFCDIGCGIIALLPIENICTTRIKSPKTELSGARRLKVIVKSIDSDGKIVLSHKELLGTWEEEAAKFEVGTTVTGIVRIIEDYGIFVQLTPNLVGLADPFHGVKPGDKVSIFIKSMMPEKMKIKLTIVNVLPDDEPTKVLHFDYKLPEDGKIESWVYSPEICSKVIKTDF